MPLYNNREKTNEEQKSKTNPIELSCGEEQKLIDKIKNWFNTSQQYKQLQNDIKTLQLKYEQLQSDIETLQHQYKQLHKQFKDDTDNIREKFNKHILESNVPYETNKVNFSQSMDYEISQFIELRNRIDIFCADDFFKNANKVNDIEFYMGESWFYHTVYKYIGQNEDNSLNLKKLSEKWKKEYKDNCKCIIEDNFTKESNNKWNELINLIKSNYKAIFCNNRYELVYPEKGTNISGEYKVEGKGKVVQFCISPGIKETSHNHYTGKDKIIWRVQPQVWAE